MAISINVNGTRRSVSSDPATPLLWVLRDELQLTGTKYGCGRGICGACTVHVDGEARRSCMTLVGDVHGKSITTIEGLSHPLQQAWIELSVAQCGYCQAGQIMCAVDLLRQKPKPSDADIDAMGVLCRCGTYQRIRAAIHLAADLRS